MNMESPRQLNNTDEQDGPSATKYESPKFFVGSGSPVGSKRKSNNSDDHDEITGDGTGDKSVTNLVNQGQANSSTGQEQD